MDQSNLEKLVTAGIIAAEFGHTFPGLVTCAIAAMDEVQTDLKEGRNYKQVEPAFQQGMGLLLLMGQISGAIENYVRFDIINEPSYDPNQALEKTFSLLRPLYEIQFIPKLTDDLPKIRLMAGLLTLCTYNAMRNSENAGTKNVQYKTESAGNFVKISFIDDGRGMNPKYVEKLVDPIQSFKTGGKGIGLATTKRIMDLCGGKLEIASPVKDDRGTAVSLYIPAAK